MLPQHLSKSSFFQELQLQEKKLENLIHVLGDSE